MLLLDVEEQRARDRIVARRNLLELRLHAVDGGALDLVGVLVEEAEAEDADRIGVGGELLDDQVVVLAGLDIGAVLADRVARLAVETQLLRAFDLRSEEHTSELQSIMRHSYA